MRGTMLRFLTPLLPSLALILGLFSATECAQAQGMPSFGRGGYGGGGGGGNFERGPFRRGDREDERFGGFGRKGPWGDKDKDKDERKGPSRESDGGMRSAPGEGPGRAGRGRWKAERGGEQDYGRRAGPRIEGDSGFDPRGRRRGKRDGDGDLAEGAGRGRTSNPERETLNESRRREPRLNRETVDRNGLPGSRGGRAGTDNPKNSGPKTSDGVAGQDPKRPWPSRGDSKNSPKTDDVATGGGASGGGKPPRDPKWPPKVGDITTGGNAKPPRDPIGGKPPSSSGGGGCFDHICPDNPPPGGGNPPKGDDVAGGGSTPPKGDDVAGGGSTPPKGDTGGTPPCRGPRCGGQTGGNQPPTEGGDNPPCRGPRCGGWPDGDPRPTPTSDDGTPPCRGPKCGGQPTPGDDGNPPCRGSRCGDQPDRNPPRPWPGRPPIIVIDPIGPIEPPSRDDVVVTPPYRAPVTATPVYEPATPDRTPPRQPQPPARQADRAPPASPPPALPTFDAPMPPRRDLATAERPQFRANEILVTIQGQNPDTIAGQVAQSFNLTIEESQGFTLLEDRRVFRFGIPDNRPVQGLTAAVAVAPGVAQTSPNFYHYLEGAGGGDTLGLQYALPKLRIPDTHDLASGRGVTVAVIDSGVEVDHPALKRATIAFFDATTSGVKGADQHGTAITGIIAGQDEVDGIAPGAKILAIRAFAPEKLGGPAITTSMALARATDMAVARGAKVVNMSFAGPRDPLIQALIEAAYKKNIVLIAAAGNQGPNAPASFPAAYPQVIGITATDENDGLYAMANRGPYVSIAAPGVDILVPVIGKALDYMSGTSFAAAHISGIAALLIERNPSLGPEDVREILLNAARDLGAVGYDEEFGAGLADAYGALVMASPKLQSSINP
jgi:subtilisin family serine protease